MRNSGGHLRLGSPDNGVPEVGTGSAIGCAQFSAVGLRVICAVQQSSVAQISVPQTNVVS